RAGRPAAPPSARSPGPERSPRAGAGPSIAASAASSPVLLPPQLSSCASSRPPGPAFRESTSQARGQRSVRRHCGQPAVWTVASRIASTISSARSRDGSDPPSTARKQARERDERLEAPGRHRGRPSEGSSLPPRFVPLTDVAEMLAISASQAYAPVRSGELRAIKGGGRGQWRVETTEIEDYIQRSYRATEELVAQERQRAEDSSTL